MTKMLRMTQQALDAFNKRTKVAKVSPAGNVGKFRPVVPTESQEQCAVIEWCDRHPIAKNIFAIPNGSNKSPATAAKFKREGLRSGVPDLFFPVPRGNYHGLFIEMKRVKGSRASLEQIDWATRLTLFGYQFQLCYGADEAIQAIKEYLGEV